jgi:hypothetical protein
MRHGKNLKKNEFVRKTFKNGKLQKHLKLLFNLNLAKNVQKHNENVIGQNSV